MFQVKQIFNKLGLWLTLILTASLLVPAVSLSAQENVTVTAHDKVCVTGSVISHAEEPLTDGWTIVAKEVVNGRPTTYSSLSTTSDANGNFRFDQNLNNPNQGITVGDWEFSIVLKPGYEPVTPDHFTLTLAYGQQDCYQIRFKLRYLARVEVVKVDDNYQRLANWTFRAEPGPDNVFAQPVEAQTNSNGIAVFNLSPGLWIITEHEPAGVHGLPVIPATGKQELNVTGMGPYTLIFKNRVTTEGCIDVYKFDVAQPISGTNFGLPGWPITVLHADGSVAATGTTDLNGGVRFEHLLAGPYQVTEGGRPRWRPVTPTSFTVTVTGGDRCEVVTFYNQQTKCEVTGRKIDLNGKVGIPGWKITAEPLAKGGYPNPDQSRLETTTDGEGVYRFTFPDNDYRLPGASYQICEEQKSGWLPVSATCYTVTLPKDMVACPTVPDFVNRQVGHAQGDLQVDVSGAITPTVAVSVSTPITTAEVSPEPAKRDNQCRASHIVQKGDMLFAIAHRYNVAPPAILRANPQVSQRPQMHLQAGETLCIP
ncbi:MAG: SpaA isopeptide-forming pilin-related protein [Caldilineaceae bacterium]